jgi:hypothetical protein
MKNYNTSDLAELVEYYEDSAYVKTDELKKFAEEIMDDGENTDDICGDLKLEIECDILTDYHYIECENQGSYHRHIWHENKE